MTMPSTIKLSFLVVPEGSPSPRCCFSITLSPSDAPPPTQVCEEVRDAVDWCSTYVAEGFALRFVEDVVGDECVVTPLTITQRLALIGNGAAPPTLFGDCDIAVHAHDMTI